MENFEDKQTFIKEIEKEYDIENLTQLGIDYWPVLKLLYFRSNHYIKNNRKLNIISRLISGFKIFIIQNLPYNDYSRILNCDQVDILFCGANTYRVEFDNHLINKFFYPVIENLPLNVITLQVDYTKRYKKENYYCMTNLFFLNRLPYYLKKSIKNIDFSEKEISLFDKLSLELSIDTQQLKNRLTLFLSEILSWSIFYESILLRIKPKYICILCYYSIPMYGLLLAANKLGIKTMDLQHGGQGEFHFAYYFYKTPRKPFNTLPTNFGSWDENSYNSIKKWTKDSYHSPIIVGHPWIDFLNKKYSSNRLLNFVEDFILFTLTIGKDDMLPEYIINAMKKSTKIWFLRFHPRTKSSDINWVKERLKTLNISNIEFKKANSIPLPLLLSKCWAHVSQASVY